MSDREIKFRVWHHSDGYMIESSQSIATVLEKYLKGWGSGMQNGNYQLDGSEYSIMQSVGIKDHTGQEVYEGDILRLYDEYDTPENYQYHEVVWGGQDYPAFHLKPGFQDTMNDFSYLLCATEAPKFEVAGNIYENSKLLTETL